MCIFAEIFKMKTNFWHLSVSLFILSVTFAQKNITNQSLLWVRYAPKFELKNNYSINVELEERTYDFPWRQHQFVARITTNRDFQKKYSLNLGFTYFLQSLPHDQESSVINNQLELRPHFGFTSKQDITNKFSLNHRYKVEFRFYEQENNSFRFQNIRFRYMLGLQYALSKKIILNTFDEIHLNVGNQIVKNVFDQNRIGFSALYKPTKNTGIELGYINWFQERSSGTDFYNRNIIRLTFHQQFNFNKKKNYL